MNNNKENSEIQEMIDKESMKKYNENYEILGLIGKGSYGCIYKGIDKKTREFRAIKIINLEKIKALLYEYEVGKIKEKLGFSTEIFIREFENMAICSENNDNSVKCYEYFINEDNFIIIMELCDQNLSQLLYKRIHDAKTGFNSEEINEIMKQLNNTFKIMREHNIIHRNIKLKDILIKYKDNEQKKYIVKLTDYRCNEKLISLSEAYQKNIGTLDYMAPEIIKGDKYNYKSDLWSIGIAVYKLFFGESPYKGFTELELIKNIEQFGNKLIRKTGNKELDDLIQKLLQKNPLKRINWDDYFNHPFFKNKYKNEINLIYYVEKVGIEKIFGEKFCENNKNNIELIINGIKNELVSEYKLKNGENNIRIIIKNKVINLEEMFIYCKALKNYEELKYLDTKEVKNFSHMFWGCSSLLDLKSLENWNVSNGNNFSYMFSGCSSL